MRSKLWANPWPVPATPHRPAAGWRPVRLMVVDPKTWLEDLAVRQRFKVNRDSKGNLGREQSVDEQILGSDK